MANREDRYRENRPRRTRASGDPSRSSRTTASSKEERVRRARTEGTSGSRTRGEGSRAGSSRTRTEDSYTGSSRTRRVYPEEEGGRSAQNGGSRRAERERRLQERKKRKKKKIILVIVEVVLLLVVAVCAFAFFYVRNLWDSMDHNTEFRREDIQTNENMPSSVAQAGEKYTTILLFGVDSRDNTNLTGRGAQADTDIIACINNETHEVKLVSVLRDSFFETTEGKHTKLTDIYSQYGVQEAIQTINRNLDLNITQYVTVNWKAVADTVNMMDGLEIELSEAEVDAINYYIWEVIDVTGIDSAAVDVDDGYESDEVEDEDNLMYHLDGVQVLTYARIRSVGHHDLTRAERQRTVITAMMEKAKTLSLTELTDICETIFPGISTNLTFNEVASLVLDVGNYTMGETNRIPQDGMYGDQTDKGPAYVYYDSLIENNAWLHEFLYGTTDYEPSDTVQEINDYIYDYWEEHP